MHLNYKITIPDWKAALQLHTRQKIGRRIHYFIYEYVFASIAIMGIVLATFAWVTGDSKALDTLVPLVAVLVGLAILLRIVRAKAIRRSYKGLFPLSENGPGYSLDINDERILSIRPGVGEATYYWSGICAVAQNDKIILLYLSEILFLGVPISALSPEQKDELDSLIARHLPKGKK